MIAIIKYNAGNISSVQNALTRLGYQSIITDEPKEILTADKVIFPGVGEASSAMKYLIEKKLDKTILAIKKPMLGICLGQQLMCEFSEEGNTKCLGIYNTLVKKFPNTDIVPHMGWNSFTKVGGTLFKNLKTIISWGPWYKPKPLQNIRAYLYYLAVDKKGYNAYWKNKNKSTKKLNV